MQLTHNQKKSILQLTGMSEELLEEAISSDTLNEFGGNDSADNFSDKFHYSIKVYSDKCVVDMWHRMTSDSQWEITPSGEYEEQEE